MAGKAPPSLELPKRQLSGTDQIRSYKQTQRTVNQYYSVEQNESPLLSPEFIAIAKEEQKNSHGQKQGYEVDSKIH